MILGDETHINKKKAYTLVILTETRLTYTESDNNFHNRAYFGKSYTVHSTNISIVYSRNMDLKVEKLLKNGTVLKDTINNVMEIYYLQTVSISNNNNSIFHRECRGARSRTHSVSVPLVKDIV